MRKLFFICAAFIVALTFESCSTNFEKLVETGKYKEAEGVLGRMKGENQNECADILIKEYLDLEEYDKAYDVYVNICKGTSKSLLLKTFMVIGDYDKVWTLSSKDKYYEWDSPHQAEHYYKYMSDVILYLCSVNNKAEANKFLNHYSFWFYTRIDSSSYYSERYPGFRYDVVKSNLQRIINTY